MAAPLNVTTWTCIVTPNYGCFKPAELCIQAFCSLLSTVDQLRSPMLPVTSLDDSPAARNCSTLQSLMFRFKFKHLPVMHFGTCKCAPASVLEAVARFYYFFKFINWPCKASTRFAMHTLCFAAHMLKSKCCVGVQISTLQLDMQLDMHVPQVQSSAAATANNSSACFGLGPSLPAVMIRLLPAAPARCFLVV